MSDSYAAISTTIEKTNHILGEIERELGWLGRPEQALSALRSVLHTLRDRLPVNEAANLGAQLPALVRGIYYEGWVPSRVPVKMNKGQFLDDIRKHFIYAQDMEIDIEQMMAAVLKAVSGYLGEGELENIKAPLPRELAKLIP